MTADKNRFLSINWELRPDKVSDSLEVTENVTDN